MNILVRNLPRNVTEKELAQWFIPFGRLKSLSIVMDPETGRSKGFGFVDMPEDSEGAAAIKALDGKMIRGEKIRVKTTNQNFKPRRNRPGDMKSGGFQFRGKKNTSRRKNSGWPVLKSQKSKRTGIPKKGPRTQSS